MYFIFLLGLLITVLSIEIKMKRFLSNQELLLKKLDKVLDQIEEKRH